MAQGHFVKPIGICPGPFDYFVERKSPGKKTCPAMIKHPVYGLDTRKNSCGIAVLGLFV